MRAPGSEESPALQRRWALVSRRPWPQALRASGRHWAYPEPEGQLEVVAGWVRASQSPLPKRRSPPFSRAPESVGTRHHRKPHGPSQLCCDFCRFHKAYKTLSRMPGPVVSHGSPGLPPFRHGQSGFPRDSVADSAGSHRPVAAEASCLRGPLVCRAPALPCQGKVLLGCGSQQAPPGCSGEEQAGGCPVALATRA